MEIKLVIMNSENTDINTIEEIITDDPITILKEKRAVKQKRHHEYLEIKIGDGIPNTSFMIVEVMNLDILSEDDLKKIINSCKLLDNDIGKIFMKKAL